MSRDTQMRSKRELIERFIQANLPQIDDSEDIPDEFTNYLSKERIAAIENLSEEENLDADKLQEVIGNYLFTEKKPMRDEIIGILKERKTIVEQVTEKIVRFV